MRQVDFYSLPGRRLSAGRPRPFGRLGRTSCERGFEPHVTSDPDRVGWRRLAHPRPPAGAGRPSQPPGPPRQGPARGPPLHRPHALLVGLALVPDRRRPRRPRRLRHPRDEAGHAQAVPGHLQVDQGADVPRRPHGRRQEPAPARRPAHVPGAGHQREPPRRRGPAEGPHVHPPGRPARDARRAEPRVADQRDELDHLPEPARRLPRRGIRGHREADRGLRVPDGQLGLGPDGLGVGLDRPHPARAVELHRARPSRLREATRTRGSAGRSPTSSGRPTTRSAGSSRAPVPTT